MPEGARTTSEFSGGPTPFPARASPRRAQTSLFNMGRRKEAGQSATVDDVKPADEAVSHCLVRATPDSARPPEDDLFGRPVPV